MSFEKIMTHPNRSTIIRMLKEGVGIRKVAQYLKEKYPKDKKMWVSCPTLQKFRQEKLNLDKIVLEDIKKASKVKNKEKSLKKAEASLKRTPAYQEAIQQAIEKHIDIKTELSALIELVKVRIEDLFNKASVGEITTNEEANLQKYFPILNNTLAQWMKYVERVADQTIETNININVIEDQMSIIRDAVRETFQEMDPTLAIKFLDNLNNKMESLNYYKKTASFNQIHKATKKISIQATEIDDTEEDFE